MAIVSAMGASSSMHSPVSTPDITTPAMEWHPTLQAGHGISEVNGRRSIDGRHDWGQPNTCVTRRLFAFSDGTPALQDVKKAVNPSGPELQDTHNRAASRTSHADHCKLRGLVDLRAETEFATIEFYRALHVRDAQREPLQSDFQHGTFPLVHMRRRSGCGTNSMSCSCSKLKIEASRATRRITLRMMIGIKLRIDVLFPTSTGLKIMP